MELDLEITCKIDNTLAMSCDELKTTYATDIAFEGLGGQRLTCSTVENKIKTEQVKLENMLDIKIVKQQLKEQQEYYREQFREWGYIKVHNNISEVISVNGYVNNNKVIELELTDLSIKQQIDKFRNIYIMPAGIGLWQTTLWPFIFRYGYRTDYIPNFWHIEYISGFDQIPEDIKEAIGKKTMLQVYNILGNILFGTGIASTSKSIDGLSQSVGTTQSATNALFGASINQFQDELKQEIPALKDKYRGITALKL